MYPPHVCTMPLGFPVEPEVYKINKGSSLSMISAGQWSSTSANASCHQTSISFQATSWPVRLSTIDVFMLVQWVNASSAMAFSGVTLAPRNPPSAVTNMAQSASFILAANAAAEKPANTTE